MKTSSCFINWTGLNRFWQSPYCINRTEMDNYQEVVEINFFFCLIMLPNVIVSNRFSKSTSFNIWMELDHFEQCDLMHSILWTDLDWFYQFDLVRLIALIGWNWNISEMVEGDLFSSIGPNWTLYKNLSKLPFSISRTIMIPFQPINDLDFVATIGPKRTVHKN